MTLDELKAVLVRLSEAYIEAEYVEPTDLTIDADLVRDIDDALSNAIEEIERLRAELTELYEASKAYFVLDPNKSLTESSVLDKARLQEALVRVAALTQEQDDE
jgi:hypothetical protein